MTRAFAVRLSLSAAAIASIAIVMLHNLGFWAAAVVPLDLGLQDDGSYVVHRAADYPLPPPLADGDVLAPQAMTPAARAAVFYGLSVPPGSSLRIAVIRGGRIVPVAVAAAPVPPIGRDWLRQGLTDLLFTPFLAALALLTLWRGRDRTAAGLCGVSLYALLAGALVSLAGVLGKPLLAVWLVLAVFETQYLIALPALYLMAEGLTGAGLSRRAKSLARASMACVALGAVALSLTREIAATAYGVMTAAWVHTAVNAAAAVMIAIPVFLLVAGYRRAPHESRLRIRWVLWSTAYLLVCILLIFALEPIADQHPILFEFVFTARALAFAGYLYAVLRTRLVDVSFVVNRALVYAGITGLLFGTFSVLELGLHELAVSDKLSWALQAITALLLALALSPLHRRLEHWVERIFFRKQRLAIASLRTFAAECPFMEQESRLVDAAVARLHPHCDAVAVYERALAGYQLRASRGDAWPETVDVDDPAFVSLRARKQEVDLHGLGSAMGSERLAFPMVVGETLSGAVLCQPRAGEKLAPDVRSALVEISRHLGTSLYILRYREQARLVSDIAAGRIDETGARQRAIAMLGGAA